MSDPLFKTVEVEFPFVANLQPVGYAESIKVNRCSICHALVQSEFVQPHADWHSGEFRRNFHGF